jgi:glycine cleavage system aminomethyltransferase T
MVTVSPPLARTPLHHWHVTRGAHFTDSDSWRVVECYTSIESETAAARTGVGLCDASAFAKASLTGPGVSALTPDLAGGAAALRPLGVAAAASHVLACRLTEDQLLLLASTTSPASLEEQLAQSRGREGLVHTDVTSALAGCCLIGPATQDLLRRVSPLKLPAAGSCAETSLAGVQALLVHPPDTVLPSIELYVAWDLAEYVWERLLDAGHGLRLTPVGVASLRQLV